MEIDNNLKREEVGMLVKELMEGGKGEKMREKALQEAVRPKGTSYINLDKYIWNSTLLTIIRSICLKCNWWAIRIGKKQDCRRQRLFYFIEVAISEIRYEIKQIIFCVNVWTFQLPTIINNHLSFFFQPHMFHQSFVKNYKNVWKLTLFLKIMLLAFSNHFR